MKNHPEEAMNKETLEKQIETKLEYYFDCARQQKCPKTMKQGLYERIAKESKKPWFSPRMAMVGLSLVLVASVVFKISNKPILPVVDPHVVLQQAQIDLKVAMYYMNQVSLKSLSEVNTKGIKPALIKPLAISVASL